MTVNIINVDKARERERESIKKDNETITIRLYLILSKFDWRVIAVFCYRLLAACALTIQSTLITLHRVTSGFLN